MDGYTRFAALIGSEKEYAIFRRFLMLHALTLLHQQAEITHLEKCLGLKIKVDKDCGDPEKALFEFYYLKLQKLRCDPNGPTQFELLKTLETKLKEYGEHMLHYRFLTALPKPNKVHLANLRSWIDDGKGGHNFFHGNEALVWDKLHEEDLTSLCIRNDEGDTSSSILSLIFVPLYHNLLGHRYKKPLYIPDPFANGVQMTPINRYADEHILFCISALTTILSPLLPVVSSLILYFIKSPTARLGVIMAFSLVFSLTVTLVTNATRAERFTAATAFAAVQVVFLGNSGGNCTIY